MTIHPITPTTPGCFGVVCPVHARCSRYQNVNGSAWLQLIATCEDGSGERPLFVEAKSQEIQA